MVFILCNQSLTMMNNSNDSKSLQAERQKKYKYYNEDRCEYEIQLTNRLAHAFSQLNMLALSQSMLNISTSQAVRKQDFLYVCLPGAPPFQNQFGFLQLPGECLSFQMSCFNKSLSEKDLAQCRTQFDEQAKLLHQRINKLSTTKPIVFVCHSYGCYTLAVYCHMFKNERIVGIIDAGGAPIRFYPAIKKQITNIDTMSLKYIAENLQLVYQNANEVNKKYGVASFANKYILLGLTKSILSGCGFDNIFQYSRHLPKVIKCFIFGRKDVIFPQNYLNQKAIYYCYKNKFEGQYNYKLRRTYERCFGGKCDNVQQKFIYSIEGGLHAIHMQRKYKDTTAKIVNRYLTFIEEVYAQQASL